MAVGGSDFHTFTASQNGQVVVTLTTAGPPATIPMGVGVGAPNGASCTLLPGASTVTTAGGSMLMGEVSGGTLCVDVYDVGNATGPVSYTVTVSHP